MTVGEFSEIHCRKNALAPIGWCARDILVGHHRVMNPRFPHPTMPQSLDSWISAGKGEQEHPQQGCQTGGKETENMVKENQDIQATGYTLVSGMNPPDAKTDQRVL